MIRGPGLRHRHKLQTVLRKRRFPTPVLPFASRELSALPNPSPSGGNQNDNDDGSVVLLYRRDTARNALPRASFLASSANSVYWLWYVFDFVPAVNASPIEALHGNPIYGFGGLGLSILIQTAFTLYPLSLVSKIEYKTSQPAAATSPPSRKGSTPQMQRDILVWKHTLPMLNVSPTPLVIPLGGITMDKASDDARAILEELGGDVGKFEGHLGLYRVPEKKAKGNESSLTINFPLLAEIRSPSEVYDSEMMLQTLLSGKFKYRNGGGKKGSRSEDESHRQRGKNQRKYGHRRKNRGAKR